MPKNAKIEYFIDRTDKRLEAIESKIGKVHTAVEGLKITRKSNRRFETMIISFIMTLTVTVLGAFLTGKI